MGGGKWRKAGGGIIYDMLEKDIKIYISTAVDQDEDRGERPGGSLKLT